MRNLNFLVGAVLFLFAALQFNDPDPIYWVIVYSGAAFVAIWKGLGRYSEFWTAVVIGAVAAGMLTATPGFFDYLNTGNFNSIFGDMQGPAYIEPTREFLGLLMAMGVLVYYVKR